MDQPWFTNLKHCGLLINTYNHWIQRSQHFCSRRWDETSCNSCLVSLFTKHCRDCTWFAFYLSDVVISELKLYFDNYRYCCRRSPNYSNLSTTKVQHRSCLWIHSKENSSALKRLHIRTKAYWYVKPYIFPCRTKSPGQGISIWKIDIVLIKWIIGVALKKWYFHWLRIVGFFLFYLVKTFLCCLSILSGSTRVVNIKTFKQLNTV